MRVKWTGVYQFKFKTGVIVKVSQGWNDSEFAAAVLALWKRDELHTQRWCAHSSGFRPTHPEN